MVRRGEDDARHPLSLEAMCAIIGQAATHEIMVRAMTCPPILLDGGFYAPGTWVVPKALQGREEDLKFMLRLLDGFGPDVDLHRFHRLRVLSGGQVVLARQLQHAGPRELQVDMDTFAALVERRVAQVHRPQYLVPLLMVCMWAAALTLASLVTSAVHNG
jgi:hypothetical protein